MPIEHLLELAVLKSVCHCFQDQRSDIEVLPEREASGTAVKFDKAHFRVRRIQEMGDGLGAPFQVRDADAL